MGGIAFTHPDDLAEISASQKGSDQNAISRDGFADADQFPSSTSKLIVVSVQGSGAF